MLAAGFGIFATVFGHLQCLRLRIHHCHHDDWVSCTSYVRQPRVLSIYETDQQRMQSHVHFIFEPSKMLLNLKTEVVVLNSIFPSLHGAGYFVGIRSV